MTSLSQVIVRGPGGAELHGPALSRALLVGVRPANIDPANRPAIAPGKIRFLSDAEPEPDPERPERPR